MVLHPWPKANRKRRGRIPAAPSKAEEMLAQHLRVAGIPHEREVMFALQAKGRRWRFDFVVGHKIGIEVDGGAWNGGRHTRPLGFRKDLEKLNAATELGWRVLRYTPEQVKSGEALAQISRLLQE